MKTLLLIAAILGTFALAGTATAASDNGATVAHDSWCTSSPFMTMCQDVWTATKVTTTPSGNLSTVVNGTSGYSLEYAGAWCTTSTSDEIHYHSLSKADETQVESELFSETLVIQCGALVRTCVSTYALHVANGATQVEHRDFACTDL